ncbi:hypothetical protein GCM10020367_33040 [Streptomyces sannanensis]|uniref:Bro-N domain-containing protein n=1 Tax=Streptomyces sannanensis TaxID=285536 RepID=A0ABP6SDD3_9ACTN
MYTEQALLETRAVRASLSHRTEALDRVKQLPLLPDGEHTTAALLAEYFEIDAVVMRRVVRKHAGELGGYGYRQLQGEELKEFLAVNMPERKALGRALGVLTTRSALVLAMLLSGSEVAHRVRLRLLQSVGARMDRDATGPVLVRAEFPVTGQPIRVVLIGSDPWFAIVDVYGVLGIENPGDARKIVEPEDIQTVELNVATVDSIYRGVVSAGQADCRRDPSRLNVVSEAGLYTLIMRSRKPAAKPFQRWVTAELLPSIRRGDTDLDAQQARMAETLAEAIGQQVHVVADAGQAVDKDITVMSDGTVHCQHGEMDVCIPAKDEDCGPPFGPYYRCPEIERHGIRGSRPLRPCGTIRFVDVVRRLTDPDVPAPRRVQPEAEVADVGSMFLSIGDAHVRGSARQIAEVLREMGVVINPRP